MGNSGPNSGSGGMSGPPSGNQSNQGWGQNYSQGWGQQSGYNQGQGWGQNYQQGWKGNTCWLMLVFKSTSSIGDSSTMTMFIIIKRISVQFVLSIQPVKWVYGFYKVHKLQK